MSKNRLEAFSDGVIAIIITIMVLELRPPHEATFSALREILPTFLSYVLSFLYVGIYWNNHHHTLQAVRSIDGAALLANLHLLFWMSLVPATTSWMGATRYATWPVVVYGVVLLLSAIAYYAFVRVLIRHEGRESPLARAIDRDYKGKASLAMYAAALPLAFVHPWISCAIYWAVAMMWLVPDARIETKISRASEPPPI